MLDQINADCGVRIAELKSEALNPKQTNYIIYCVHLFHLT